MLSKIIVVLTGLLITSSSSARDFTCEKIKDKATRNLCIKDRKAKEAETEESNAKKKLEEDEKQKIDERKREVSEFVKQAQNELVRNFKDPQSAQFTDLKVDIKYQSLCGQVNGKNSYGGYVGARSFYVYFIGNVFSSKIIELPKNKNYADIYQSEMDILNLVCRDAQPFQ